MATITADNVAQTIAAFPRTSGSVLYAPVGTPLPTTSYEVLDSGFTDLGYIDEAGVRTAEDRVTTDVFGWGGELINTLQDRYSRTMTFTMYQFLDSNVLAAGYANSNITVQPSSSTNGTETAVALNSRQLDTLSWVFDGHYFNNAGLECLIRMVVPIGRIIKLADLQFTNKALTGVAATMKAFPDANHNASYIYTNDGNKTGSGGIGGS